MSKLDELFDRIDTMQKSLAEKIADTLLEEDAEIIFQALAINRRAQISVCAARQEYKKTSDPIRSLEPALQGMYYIGYASALREWHAKMKEELGDDVQERRSGVDEG